MFTLIDAARLVAAALLGVVVIALPGVALARSFRLACRDGVVVGLAVLPLLDSLITRFLGLDTTLAATIVLATCGAGLLLSDWRRAGRIDVRWQPLVLCALWLAVVVVASVDFDVARQLYQPLTVVDTVKHAATTQAIVDSGAPPHDPFFLRPQRVSYYYLFYMLPALVERLGFGLIDARAAFGGCVVWVGFGLYSLVRLALEHAGFAPRAGRRALVIALLAASGLDILGVLRAGLLQGTWLADPAAWNEQVTGWFESLLWVPHHVTGLIAGMLGLMTMADLAAPTVTRPHRARSLGLAALCFAATLGLSVWLALVLAATGSLWGLVLLCQRRWRLVGDLGLVGLFALILASPQIIDLFAGRASGGAAAVALTVRSFTPVDGIVPPGPMRMVVRALFLPVNYFAGFGVLAAGAILFWRTRNRAQPMPEFARVLVIAAIAGLTLGAFLRSTLFSNDLGWRVVLFPFLAAVVWTVAALERAPFVSSLRRAPAFLLVLLGIGWATTVYAAVELRFYPWLARDPETAFVAADPATERALRIAYGWADVHLPAATVLQHNPTRPRAFAFALYGRHPVAVADKFGSLYGADPRQVDDRITALGSIFTDPLAPSQVRARALANGIDALIVTAADPVWSQRESFAWRANPAYASERVRIIPVSALAEPTGGPPANRTGASAMATGRGN